MTFNILARDDESSQHIAKELKHQLLKKGYNEKSTSPDFIFFVGGDGTFLRAVQDHLNYLDDTVFIGIHSGSLGFFCEFSADQLTTLVSDSAELVSRAKSYRLLEMNLMHEHGMTTYYAVNEVRIENPFQTLVTHVFIDEEELESFRGTGLIVSSTLGSSAYNRSLGGALVDGTMPSLQLTEMAPIHNYVYRSLGSSMVLHPERSIQLRGDFSSAIFGFDHQLHQGDKPILEVRIKLSSKTIKIVHQDQRTYVETIRRSFLK